MNFIKHFNALMDRIAMDERLTPYHVSLYFTLFQSWNLNHFKNPISIAREETMKISKIGSVNTYTRCIKQLDQCGYLKYEPSFNPQRGSKVHLYRFDKGSDKAKGQLLIMPVRPSTNNINLLNNNKHSLYMDSPLSDLIKVTNASQIQENNWVVKKKEKTSGKKERKVFHPPTQQEVIHFFKNHLQDVLPLRGDAEGRGVIEAQKFFNYYQSTGWKVGKNKPMQDWQAAARNWILNAKDYAHETHQSNHTANTTAKRNGHLHINPDKDYGEPL